MPNAPAYDPIGNNAIRWYECLNLLKATSAEHRNTYPEDEIEKHIQTLKQKEIAKYLRVWYVPNEAETEIDFVAFFQKMKALSASKTSNIWALSIGFKQSLIPYSSPDNSTEYEKFLKKYFEDSHGRCGGGTSLTGEMGTPIGVLGYFLKNIIGDGSLAEVYSVGLKSNQLDLNSAGGEKITRLERAAFSVYNDDQHYWKIDPELYVRSYKKFPWGGGTEENPNECVVYRTYLKKIDPEGPKL